MNLDPLHRAIYLVGPTASGKTGIGVELARILGAEVIALDSMTLYRGMDIGTAKPTIGEMRGIPHVLIDVLDPWEAASVADYRGWAIEAVAEVEGRGRIPLFVGGTALYLKALLRGLFEGPGADPTLRGEMEAEADRDGDAALHARLSRVDPATAARLAPADRRRVIRALEVFAITGTPLSRFQTSHDQPARDVRVFALERPRDELANRIDRRVVEMFRGGLLDEVETLRSGPHPFHPTPSQGVGYGEALAVLEKRLPLGEAIERTQARTRQFAKRQRTWFRGLAECRPWPILTGESPVSTAERLAREVGLGGKIRGAAE